MLASGCRARGEQAVLSTALTPLCLGPAISAVPSLACTSDGPEACVRAVQVEHAISDGYDVRSFLYWTLVDNFEVRSCLHQQQASPLLPVVGMSYMRVTEQPNI